jgi:hypothetical protein
MKKIIKLFVYVAAAAMALASCQKNEMDAPVKKNVHFTIKAGIETKTYIEATPAGDKTIYTPKWDGTEDLGVLFSIPNAETEKSDAVVFENTASGNVAKFQGTVSVAENGTFYSFYPADAFNRGYKEGDVRLDLKKEQSPTATSFDPSCDILVAKPYDFTVTDGQVVADGLTFKRVMSVLRIDLKTDFEDVKNEYIKSLTFTAGDVKIVGYARVFLDNPDFTTQNWASSGDGWNEVTANYNSDLVSIGGASNSVYLVIAPVTIPVGKELTFDIKTKNYNISKTVTLTDEIGAMNFSAGNVNKINLNIKADNCQKIDTSIDYSGDYLIVNSDLTRAANAWSNGNNLPEFVLTTNGGVVIESDGIANCKMTINKEADGYTIQDASGKYLYAAGGTGTNASNHLKGQDDKSYWTIEKDGENYLMKSLSGASRNILRYNSSSKIFSCYASGQAAVTLYLYGDIQADTTPRITLDKSFDNVEAIATSYEYTYTTKNITGDVTCSVKDGATMVVSSVAADKGTVRVTFDANDDSETKTATIVLSYEGAEDAEFVLSQAGKPAEGGEPAEVATWSWTGGVRDDFENFNGVISTTGIGDYAVNNAPYRIKLDSNNDNFVVKVDGAIQSVSVGVKMIGGASTSYLDFQGSSDGSSYSSVQKHTISGKQNDILELTTSNTFDASYRYIKFNFTKGSNVGVGPITITYIPDNEGGSGGDDPEQPTVTVSTTIANYAAANGWTNSTKYATVNLDNVVTATVTGGSNTGKYYTSGTNWRIYQNESPTLKISASDGYTLKTVKITYDVDKTGVLTLNGSNITSGSDVTVNAASITFGVGNTSSSVTNGQVRVTKIEVVYQKN